MIYGKDAQSWCDKVMPLHEREDRYIPEVNVEEKKADFVKRFNKEVKRQ